MSRSCRGRGRWSSTSGTSLIPRIASQSYRAVTGAWGTRRPSDPGRGPGHLRRSERAAAPNLSRDCIRARGSRHQEAARSSEGRAGRRRRRVDDGARRLVRRRRCSGVLRSRCWSTVERCSRCSWSSRRRRPCSTACPEQSRQYFAAMASTTTFLAAEREAMRDVRIAPTNDRSVVGVMNEFAFHGEHRWKDGTAGSRGAFAANGEPRPRPACSHRSGSPGRELRRVSSPSALRRDTVAASAASVLPAQGHPARHEAADLAPSARRRGQHARPRPRGDPGRLRLVELPPPRVRGRPRPLRRPRPRRRLGRATPRRAAHSTRRDRRRRDVVPLHLRLRRRLGTSSRRREGAAVNGSTSRCLRVSTVGERARPRTAVAPGATGSCSRSSPTRRTPNTTTDASGSAAPSIPNRSTLVTSRTTSATNNPSATRAINRSVGGRGGT